jgi:hypothetical protein
LGPDYLLVIIGLIVPSITGAGWVVNKLFTRFHHRIIHTEKRMDSLEANINSMYHRLPIEYVLKVDFLREIQQMQDNFKQINIKLDKLIEKL